MATSMRRLKRKDRSTKPVYPVLYLISIATSIVVLVLSFVLAKYPGYLYNPKTNKSFTKATAADPAFNTITLLYNPKTSKVESAFRRLDNENKYQNRINIEPSLNQDNLPEIYGQTPIAIKEIKATIEKFDSKGVVLSSNLINSDNLVLTYRFNDDNSLENIEKALGVKVLDIEASYTDPSTMLFKNTGSRNFNETYDILLASVGFNQSELGTIKSLHSEFSRNILRGSFFRDNQDRINIKRTDEILSFTDLWCDDRFCSNLSAMEALKAKYNADSIVFLMNNNDYIAYGMVDDNYSFVSKTAAKAVVHEFGHSLGGLGDEYIYAGYETTSLPRDLINCKKSCSGFSSQYNQAGCFSGCSYGLNSFRVTNDSIMRTSVKEFDALGTDMMSSRLKQFAPDKNGLVIAKLVKPATDINMVINSSKLDFTWSKGNNVEKYKLTLGTTKGANDLNCSYEGTNTSVNCPNSLVSRINSKSAYLRLSSYSGGAWSYNDYEYYVSIILGVPTLVFDGLYKGEIYTPYKFNWNKVSDATGYRLSIGSEINIAEVYDKTFDANTLSVIVDYKDLISKFSGRKQVSITLSAFAENTSSITKVDKYVNSIDNTSYYPCKDRSITDFVSRLGLKTGSSYSWAIAQLVLKKAPVNYPFRNLTYSRTGSNSMIYTLDQDTLKCAGLFRAVTKEKLIYEGLIGIWPVSASAKLSNTIIKNSLKDEGAYLMVIESNKSLTPYQVFY